MTDNPDRQDDKILGDITPTEDALTPLPRGEQGERAAPEPDHSSPGSGASTRGPRNFRTVPGVRGMDSGNRPE
jgi:hypothetical protein